MSTNKELAMEIYQKHITLASTDGRLFRRTVMGEMQLTMPCTVAASATHYNNCKKASAPVEGLGRAAVPNTVRKMPKGTSAQQEIPEEECYTVIEVRKVESLVIVGRTHSFEGLGLARINLKEMIGRSPNSKWKLIMGLGPNSGDSYKLALDEKVITEYEPPVTVC